MQEINYRILAEKLYIKEMVEDKYPSGIISLVSDTFNLWDVLEHAIPSLKESILKRSGAPLNKVVIRPDSGNPADIICGDPSAPKGSPASKGVIELLHETFGGTKTEQGYILLNEKIGAIYGDSITLSIAEEICERLAQKGFASTNIVLGIGSFTYQFLTRDSLGFAMKATSATVNGVERDLFKDPITDSGVKKSAKGRVEVRMDANGNIECFDSERTDTTGFSENMLMTVFLNGNIVRETSLSAIREKLKNESL